MELAVESGQAAHDVSLFAGGIPNAANQENPFSSRIGDKDRSLAWPKISVPSVGF